jgi:endonuclease YncB( thermonuclease family)
MVRLLLLIFTSALSACGGGDGASFAPPTAATHCGLNVGTERLTGKVNSVRDGDTITVGVVSVRLASIDAPELSQTYGQPSRADLAAIVLDQTVTVAFAQTDRYDRVVGTVFKADCTNVNLKMVQEGAAWYYEAFQCEIDLRQRQDYAAAHAQARAANRGLWAGDAMAPWVYRNGVDAKVPNSCPNGDAASL